MSWNPEYDTIYSEGYEAYFDGVPWMENPYEEDYALTWGYGWESAKHDDRGNKITRGEFSNQIQQV